MTALSFSPFPQPSQPAISWPAWRPFAARIASMLKLVRGLTQALVVILAVSMMTSPAHAAGQSEQAEDRLWVEYDGTRYFLTRQLLADELHELLSGNTLIFMHPSGNEQEFHRENGQTLNGWEDGEDASAGFWQIEGDEICWTYPSGTHCKPVFQSERDNLYGQVPGWYDGPLAFIWEPGDSRGLSERPVRGNAI